MFSQRGNYIQGFDLVESVLVECDRGEMKPCLACGKNTVYREKSPERYFCNPECQQAVLSGLAEEFGGKQPDFISNALWERMVDFEKNRGNKEEKYAINKRLVNELDQYTTRVYLFEYLWKLAIYENDVEEITIQKEVFKKCVDVIKKHDHNLEETPRDQMWSVRGVSESLLRSKNFEFDDCQKWRDVVKDLTIKAGLTPEKYTISEIQQNRNLAQSQAKNLTLFLADYLLIVPEPEPEPKVEEMIVEEKEKDEEEVKTGLTQIQYNILSQMKKNIRMEEKGKLCIKYITSYLKACDIIMHLNLKKFLTRGSDTIQNDLELYPEYVDDRKRRLEADRVYFPPEYENLPDSEKVKYGVLNWAHERKGCTQFTEETTRQSQPISYLIFKDSVKRRSTYSRYETLTNGGPKAKFKNYFGTINHLCAISHQFESSVKRSMEHYNLARSEGNSAMRYTDGYMEIQLHGELLFARDVAKIMISTSVEQMNEVYPLLENYFKKIGRVIPYDFI